MVGVIPEDEFAPKKAEILVTRRPRVTSRGQHGGSLLTSYRWIGGRSEWRHVKGYRQRT
ncbi:hypothetical protein FHU34_113228 [Micromonospora taraxaci]|uniref:Uncharacterized protein n=1 Tax=Micromonospora taraxaci TaxID=1316803 RepID=A0A561W204_9ACTN|nr:hypothetical protein FHU34_113228 [Micromonospora taraxaci]